uniref:Uncharacterized protein n=1 Tax=Medicago truncatula TaxID=3880 RepID=I3T6E9_MEDTR|nr:unknown [Medicago truncatula]
MFPSGLSKIGETPDLTGSFAGSIVETKRTFSSFRSVCIIPCSLCK